MEEEQEEHASGGSGRTVLVAGVAVLLVLGVAAAVAGLEPRGEPRPVETLVIETPVPLDQRPPPGRQEPLPDLVLDGFDGGDPVDLAAYRGQPLVVNLWASWCGPCIEEMPEIQEVATELDGRVAVLGVNTRDARANAVGFADELGISYDLAADPDAELFRAIRAFGMPTTLLVTPDGTIVYRHTGLIDAEGLRNLIRERLDLTASDRAGWRLGGSLG